MSPRNEKTPGNRPGVLDAASETIGGVSAKNDTTAAQRSATLARRKSVHLNRQTFTTSRMMDFFSEKELTAQIGHPTSDWPQVCVKELVDNSLDACEDAGIAPEIEIIFDSIGISVSDNGAGIPADTVTGLLDYTVKVSSREAYVAPDRGAQGNALKTIVAMPFVLNGQEGCVDIYSQGVHHHITCRLDRIKQEPVISHSPEPSNVKNGSSVIVHWPDSASSDLRGAERHFLQIAESFTFLNPHLSLKVDWFGEKYEWTATDNEWSSWKPSSPTSPHWYQPEHLSRLIAAYLGQEDGRTIREFISEFRGLSGSAKQKRVLDDTDLGHQPLTALVSDGELNAELISRLLDSMKAHTKPVSPKLLGIIGEKHMRIRCEELGCEMGTFSYQKKTGDDDGLPWVVEMAFAWRGEEAEQRRKLVTGVNWSAGIINPFRQLGKYGQSMDTVLTEARAGADEPVVMIMHMACPRVTYSDRGKSSVVLEG